MKKQLLILALAGLAFTACKKDDDGPQNTQQLKKITEISDGDTTITNLTYDNSKRITLVKGNDGTETKLTYTSSNLTLVENKIDAANRTKLEIAYDGAKPTTAVYSIYENNVLENKYKYTYTVNAANLVTEILMKDSTNTTVVAKEVFTYTNANITKVESYVGSTLFSTQEFTYGSKKSMFYNTRINYVVDPFLAQVFSANDVTKEKLTIGTTVNETTNTLTYDAAGFPLTVDVSKKQLPNGTPETSKLKFEY
jgi:hypothetical protein